MPARMFHHAAHGHAWTPLYRDADEAARLWRDLTRGLPGLIALCVMPDHLHLVHAEDVRDRLRVLTRAYGRWRNTRRSEPGRAVWAPIAPPDPIAPGKLATHVRYVHLNPCRARLVADPLGWPLSTHRDAVGLTLGPVRRVERSPQDFHAYVSGDPSVHPAGTGLPHGQRGTATLSRVADVVAGLARVPVHALSRRGPTRAVWLGASAHLVDAPIAAIAREASVSRGVVHRAPGPTDPRVELVCRVVHDPRFAALEDLVASRARRPREPGPQPPSSRAAGPG